MLNSNSKVAVYMEGHIDSDYGKMGMGVVRYLKNQNSKDHLDSMRSFRIGS